MISFPQTKQKTVWITPKTGFNDSLGRLYNKPDDCSGYELVKQDRWDEASIIWKPIIGGPDYANLSRLEFLSTLVYISRGSDGEALPLDDWT